MQAMRRAEQKIRDIRPGERSVEAERAARILLPDHIDGVRAQRTAESTGDKLRDIGLSEDLIRDNLLFSPAIALEKITPAGPAGPSLASVT